MRYDIETQQKVATRRVIGEEFEGQIYQLIRSFMSDENKIREHIKKCYEEVIESDTAQLHEKRFAIHLKEESKKAISSIYDRAEDIFKDKIIKIINNELDTFIRELVIEKGKEVKDIIDKYMDNQIEHRASASFSKFHKYKIDEFMKEMNEVKSKIISELNNIKES